MAHLNVLPGLDLVESQKEEGFSFQLLGERMVDYPFIITMNSHYLKTITDLTVEDKEHGLVV